MSKTIKGHEIFKLIANKEVKDGTQFRMLKDENIYTYRNNNFVCKYGGMNVIAILNNEFEIIEDEQEIDIQDINNRLIKLEKMVDRFEYIEKRVETIDAQNGNFQYC